MKRKKNVFKKIIFIILFVILLPVILLVLLFKAISKRARYNLYKKNRVSGRTIILSSNIDEIEKMQDFELEDFFKYFYFYSGYTVNEKNENGTLYNFVLSLEGNMFLARYTANSKINHKKQIDRLAMMMERKNIPNGIYTTTSELDFDTVEYASSKAVVVMDRAKVEGELAKLKERLERDMSLSGFDVNKPIDELIDQMYPYRI